MNAHPTRAKEHLCTVMATGRTIFVRNLPFSATDEQLQELFCDVGEIKRRFVVREHGVRDKCRGFGYVTFTTPEEAQEAVKKTVKFKGRVLNLSLADRRPLKKRTAHEDEAAAPPVAKRQKIQSKARPPADIGRTVVLKNLAEVITKKQIYKKCRKFGHVEETVFPVEDREQAAFVKFVKHHDARVCVTELNGRVFIGQTVTAVLASREGKEPSKISLMKARLIVRNLSFNSSEDELRNLFSKHGKVIDVSIPVRHGTEKTRVGCAFVQFANVFEAARAMKEVNMTEIGGRPVAVDWAIPKNTYQSAMSEKRVESTEERVEELANEESDGDAASDESEEQSEEGSDNEGIDETEGNDEEAIEESESDDHESIESSSVKADESVKRYKPDDASEGRTVFVRGLPFVVDQSTVIDFFSQFGGVRYCRMMKDRDSGLPKGTAFVQFKEPASVTRCVAASSADSGLILDGRKLDVLQAVTPREAKRIAEETASSKDKMQRTDKRNLHLAKEGLILPGSESAKVLPRADLVKRQKAEAEKRLKLKNPNFFVSTTRLCVRNIPLTVDDKKLKDIFAKAGGVPKSGVVQVKIMRNTDRVDISGLARSRGYGFVQFRDHDAALRALRYTNNNPECFGPDRRLIVEFSLENQQVLKSRQQKMTRQKQRFPVDKKKAKQQPILKAEGKKKVKGGGKEKVSGTKEEKTASEPATKKLRGKRRGEEASWVPVKRARQEESVKARTAVRTGEKRQGKLRSVAVKVDRDEELFSRMVQNYKTKLFGRDAFLDRSRWFE